LILKTLLNLPGPLIRLIAGGRITRDGQELDSQSQMANYLVAKFAKAPIEAQSAEANRAAFFRLAKNNLRSPVRNIQNSTVAGPSGEIPIRIYHPEDLQPSGPAIVYFHGGGWVLGDLKSYDFACGSMAQKSGCKVISVDYRLAPEHPYPAAIDDCFAAFQAISASASDFGIDAKQIAVAGDSAGGNLAAAVCQRNKSQGPEQACFQLLVYPVTDVSQEHESYRSFADGFLLSSPAMRWFIEQYAPDPIRRTEAHLSPLLADDLTSLPPALVILAGFDPLRDEGIRYAQKLHAANVPTQWELFPTTVHGFFGMAHLDVSDNAMDLACNALRNAFIEKD
jgi:acetyl esterase